MFCRVLFIYIDGTRFLNFSSSVFFLQNLNFDLKIIFMLMFKCVFEIILKLPNLHMLLRQRNPSLPRNLILGTFGESLIVFLTKVNLIYLLYSMAQSCYLLPLIKQNCLLKTFLRTLILMIRVSLCLFSLLELI